ncbi:hypothetical protein Dsin_022849 [Dipteronia sinensis]|uniref:Uncharacterized protein n=1 Tax=Dipteronia sinensis TaxID=43782 RepID=A0AAE0E0G6_9ROSI|nr:hypothetical protein Dsin_022849 [Dipteronia sinensis]
MRLRGRIHPVNALCFVGYFTEMIPDDMCPSPRIVKEIIIQSSGNIDSTQYRPSVISASCVLIASSVRFPERFNECLDCFSPCNRVNMGDLSKCTELILEICRKIHIFGVTSLAGEASSSSSSAFDRPGKEPVAESSRTMEEIETRPGKEPAVEISEELKSEDIVYFELKWISDEYDSISMEVDAPVNEEAAPEGDEVDVDEAEDNGADADDEGYEGGDEAEDNQHQDSEEE